MAQDGLIAALDIGSSKVCCLVAERGPAGSDALGRVRGMGMRLSEGMRGGILSDPRRAEEAIRAAVGQAEKIAGTSVEDIWVSVAPGSMVSHMIDVVLPLSGRPVDDGDIDAAMNTAISRIEDGLPSIVHAFPAAFMLDGQMVEGAPIGLVGDELIIYAHIVTVAPAVLHNLDTVLRAAHLQSAGFVVQPLASGLGCLRADEMLNGAACIDIGAGTTGIGMFVGGTLAHAEMLSWGSERLVKAISGQFVTSLPEAERLLALHGAALHDPSDNRYQIDLKILDATGQESETQMPRRHLTHLIEDTLRALFLEIAERLEMLGFDPGAGQRLVLTGSMAQVSRLAELARSTFGTGARLGLPLPLDGLPVSGRGPGYTTTVGLLRYAVQAKAFTYRPKRAGQSAGAGHGLLRLWRWARTSF